MKRRKPLLLTVVACLLLLAGVLGWQLLSSYNLALQLNWGISIPFWARPTQCYEKDSGPSFLGDGIRYHIFSYQYENFIDQMFAWGSVDRETIYFDSFTQAAETWLDEIEVPAEYRPDYDRRSNWYRAKDDNSEILIFWNADLNRLYILESIF